MVNPSSIRVVFCDDDAVIRAHIRAALEAGGCEVCAEGATAEEAVALAVEHRPDVVLLDICLPGNGIRAAQQISRALRETAIVILTQSIQDEDLFDSLRAGASGYLDKGTDLTALPEALRGVLRGEAAIAPRLVTRILQEFRAPTRRPLPTSFAAGRLTAREWEVMQLLSQGHSTEQVGSRLFVSPTTVRVHVSTVLRKLRVADRQGAFRLLRQQ